MFYLSRKSKKKESCNTRSFVKNNIIDVFQIMLQVKKEIELKHVLKALQKVIDKLQKVFNKSIRHITKVFNTL